MLAIGRALMAEPRLLMLDEPSIGLAPLIVREILRVIGQLKAESLTIILVEQNARLALSVADRGYVLEVGRIVLEGRSPSLAANPRLSQAYLGGAADYAAARDQVYAD
jgi:branched-chain amino acid transport system ATP-binding protein